MRAVSLFSGCLGLDLGLETLGVDTVMYCENDTACQQVIRERRPGTPILDDVRKLDADLAAELGEIVLLAGGFPCQDLSHAGKGEGLSGERSGLWFEMERAIRLLRPRRVLIENVPGLVTKSGVRPGESALGTVISDLAEAGYVGSQLRLRASDVGAPHGRERIFLIAADASADPGGARRREVAGGAQGDEGAARRRAADDDHVARRPRARGVPTAGRTIAADAAGDVGAELEEGDGGESAVVEREPRAGAGDRARGTAEGVLVVGGSSGRSRRARSRGAAADSGCVAGAAARERDGGPGASGEPGARGDQGQTESGVTGSDRKRGAAAANAGGDGLVRVAPVDGENGGVGVESGHDVDGRALGDAGPDDGHAREAAADADAGGRGRRQDYEGVRSSGGDGAAPDRAESDRKAPADTDGAGLSEHGGPVAVRAQLGSAERGGGEALADADVDASRGQIEGVEGEGRRGRDPRDPQPTSDAGGEPAESRNGRGATRSADSRARPAQRDGRGLVGTAEPRPHFGEASADPAGEGRGERERAGVPALRGAGGQPDAAGGGTPDDWDAPALDWGVYRAAVERWERIFGFRAPQPTDDRGRLNPEFVEWMMGFPIGWTDVGKIGRTARLRMLGNAVQVQVAMVIGALALEGLD